MGGQVGLCAWAAAGVSVLGGWKGGLGVRWAGGQVSLGSRWGRGARWECAGVAASAQQHMLQERCSRCLMTIQLRCYTCCCCW